MPIYEYKCKKCRHEFEELRGYDDPAPSCEKCEAKETAKLISRTSFALKGHGWFKDHYGLKKPVATKES